MKEHPKYKGYYATEEGHVFKGTKFLKGCRSTVGYWQYGINGSTVLGHRFVYECFNNVELTRTDIINHLDSNPINNRIENLELTTQKGNVGWYWAANHSLIIQPDMTVRSTARNSMAKLTDEQAKEIILLCLSGKTNTEISEMYQLHSRYVSLIRHKKRWKRIWVELDLERSETIPSGSRQEDLSKWQQS